MRVSIIVGVLRAAASITMPKIKMNIKTSAPITSAETGETTAAITQSRPTVTFPALTGSPPLGDLNGPDVEPVEAIMSTSYPRSADFQRLPAVAKGSGPCGVVGALVGG